MQDVFGFVNVAEVALAPRGGAMAAVLVRRDRQADRRVPVLMLRAPGADWAEVPGSAGCSTLRFSPDGTVLARLGRQDERSALILRDAAGAERVLVACAEPLREIAWSPDGTRIAFQRFVPAPGPAWFTPPAAPEGADWGPSASLTERLLWRHDTVGRLAEGSWQTFVVPAGGGEARQVTQGPWFSGFMAPPGLGWTPDGAALVLAASCREDWDAEPGEIRIQMLRLDDGSVRELTDEPGAQAHPAVSPCGRFLAYTAVAERHMSGRVRHAMLRDLATGEARRLAPGLDRPVDGLAWAADGTAVYLCADGPGHRGILRVALDGTVEELLRDVAGGGIEMPYAGGGFSLGADGSVAYVRGAVDVPGEIALRGPNGDVADTTALTPAGAGFRPAERFTTPSRRDGAAVEAWLITPPGTPPAAGWPVILEIHGGPYAQYGDRFSIKHQAMAAAGYAVLFANPRGSTGYGEAFATALHGDFPGIDHDDLTDVLDAVVARPEIDANRQFITGISGGGTLTLWAIGQTDRFRAAVSIKPVTAWESWMLTADIGPSIGRVWMGGDLPWQAGERFRAVSPLTRLHRARTPTLVVAGEADVRTPASEAEQAYATLKLAGVEAAFLRFPGTSHSSATMRPSFVQAETDATIAWFRRFDIA